MGTGELLVLCFGNALGERCKIVKGLFFIACFCLSWMRMFFFLEGVEWVRERQMKLTSAVFRLHLFHEVSFIGLNYLLIDICSIRGCFNPDLIPLTPTIPLPFIRLKFQIIAQHIGLINTKREVRTDMQRDRCLPRGSL